MKTILLKAKEGYYKNGNIYAKVVLVKEIWKEHWTLVSEEEANADTNARKMNKALHVIKENI